MTTQTDIANRALQALGIQKRISSVAQDSAEAQAIGLIIGVVLDQITRLAPWTSSIKTANLNLIYAAPGTPENPSPPTNQWTPGQPIPPWIYEYAYPGDCLRALWLQSTYVGAGAPSIPISPVTFYSTYYPDQNIPFKVQTDTVAGVVAKVLLTNAEMPTLTYLGQITDPDLMDPMLQEAWVLALASRLAPSLTEDKNLKPRLVQETNALISMARATDANEEFEVPDHTPDWIRVRGYGERRPYAMPYPWGGLWT